MEKILEILRYHFSNKSSNVNLWLSEDGEVIESNICTLYPIDLTLIGDLHLVVDVYMANACDNLHLRFFKSR